MEQLRLQLVHWGALAEEGVGTRAERDGKPRNHVAPDRLPAAAVPKLADAMEGCSDELVCQRAKLSCLA